MSFIPMKEEEERTVLIAMAIRENALCTPELAAETARMLSSVPPTETPDESDKARLSVYVMGMDYPFDHVAGTKRAYSAATTASLVNDRVWYVTTREDEPVTLAFFHQGKLISEIDATCIMLTYQEPTDGSQMA